MTICAIHQPNFFPWLGYFDKIKNADVFIFLDEVDYPKSGSGAGSWSNRVKILSNGQPNWLGLPIKREPGAQRIKDVCFSNKAFTLNKIKKTLDHNYIKHKYYDMVMNKLSPLLMNADSKLSTYNMNAIIEISKILQLKTSFIKQSDLKHKNQSNELLIELIQQVGGTTYLCGNGSDGYQDDSLFERANIQISYQEHPLKTPFLTSNIETERSLSIIHHLICYHDELIAYFKN